MLKYVYMYIRLGPGRPSQDLISITLMNGRALLLCVVGVRGLLGKEGTTVSWLRRIIMTITQGWRLCVCSPVNDLWLVVIGQGGRGLTLQEVLHVVVHFSVL